MKVGLIKIILGKIKSIFICCLLFFFSCREEKYSNTYITIKSIDQYKSAKIEGWVEVIEAIGSKKSCNEDVAYSSFYKVITSVKDTCIIISPCDGAFFKKGDRAWFFKSNEERRVLKVASDSSSMEDLQRYPSTIGRIAIPEE